MVKESRCIKFSQAVEESFIIWKDTKAHIRGKPQLVYDEYGFDDCVEESMLISHCPFCGKKLKVDLQEHFIEKDVLGEILEKIKIQSYRCVGCCYSDTDSGCTYSGCLPLEDPCRMIRAKEGKSSPVVKRFY